MEAFASPVRVLVVAHRTAATPALLEAVRARAVRGPVAFTLLVPDTAKGLDRASGTDQVDHAGAAAVLDQALPVLQEAAGGPVDGMTGDASPMDAIQDAINLVGFDEVIISTLPHRVSRWLRLDLPSKVAGLGLPVTTITATDREPVSTA